MNLIPGWESIADSHWWSNFYFGLSIVALILLGAFEVVSHRYAERHDELAANERRAADQAHEGKIARLNRETADLVKQAANARSQIASSQTEAARANEHAAELKLELAREIAARQPRQISKVQHDAIVRFLASAQPKGPIVVVSKQFDDEAERFAQQIVKALIDAGFHVTKSDGSTSFGLPGAWILVRDLAAVQLAPSSIGAIQAAFRNILGIELDGQQRGASFPDLGETIIVIGSKP